jgi:hypothetical protein
MRLAKAPADCSIANSTQFHLHLLLRSSAIREITPFASSVLDGNLRAHSIPQPM